ncbi:3-ketoacyl-ACP reductase [Tumebacillus algifaecis]|uniref:3-ketoacyl-ACP reductase n=1 Tax=Tumebacillus algifaecis TaxID=1214604 RepID=A0A223D1L8_9BACL|nr:SDR family oxidoreductase [Tumebacillus algifaecis]ASS75343.1 3-ketoacyl-ACP reductase [Tumebacillus algifaecis]
MNTFTNRIVLVSGAAQGIGRVVAQTYAARGASVIAVDLASIALDQVTAIQADLRDPQAIESLFAEVQAQYGRLDILINNAGISRWKSPYELTVEEWDEVLNLNLRGSFLCAREAAKLMKAGGGGKIVNMSSTRALMSEPNTEAYAASKGGLLALTHALAVSLGPDQIQVNAISPGWIETKDYSQLRAEDHAQHPSGRVGRPEDIANACLYLTDPANDFITGVNLVIDGGMTRKMIYLE